MDSPNRTAVELVDEAIDFADELRIDVHHLDNDAVVLDFGVDADGGLEAGLLLAEIQTGGLATVQHGVGDVAGATLPYVELFTDHPQLALLACQPSTWELAVDGFDGRGSGPARLRRDDDVQGDEFDLGVLALESSTLPDEDVAATVATEAGLPTSGLYLPTTPVSSPAGRVAMAARAAEVALHRLRHLGYDPADVLAASGRAPVMPVPEGHDEAAALANDGLAYGSRVHLVVERDAEFLSELPFSATPYAGESLTSTLADATSFASVEDAFAPAAATVDVRGGPTHVLGGVDEAFLRDQFGR